MSLENEAPIHIAQDMNTYRIPGSKNSTFLAALFELFEISWITTRLDDSHLGYLLVQENNIFIGSNQKHSRYRQLLSAAHMLGHYLMKHYTAGQPITCCGFSSTLTREIEAITFAEELLMPRERLAELKDKYNTEQLAIKLEIPSGVMRRRLDELR